MPTYEFECQKCGDRHEIIMKMTEIGNYSRECKARKLPYVGDGDSLPEANHPSTYCGGELLMVWDNDRPANAIFLGSGWTPKFGPTNAPDTRFRIKG